MEITEDCIAFSMILLSVKPNYITKHNNDRHIPLRTLSLTARRRYGITLRNDYYSDEIYKTLYSFYMNETQNNMILFMFRMRTLFHLHSVKFLT